MTCEVCGVDGAQRFHDGRYVCAAHKHTVQKVAALATEKTNDSAAAKQAIHDLLESTRGVVADLDAHRARLEEQRIAHGALSARVTAREQVALATDAAHEAVSQRLDTFAHDQAVLRGRDEAARRTTDGAVGQLSVDLAVQRERLVTVDTLAHAINATVEAHHQRLLIAESSLQAARDLLGDVSTRGDVTAQIGALAAEIAALKISFAAHTGLYQSLALSVERGSTFAGQLDIRLMNFIGRRTFWQRLRWLLLGR